MNELYEYAKTKKLLSDEMKDKSLTFPTKGYQTVIVSGTLSRFTMKGDGSSRDRLKGKSGLFEIKEGVVFLNNEKIGGANSQVTLKFKRILDTPYPRHSGTDNGDMAIGDINGDHKKDIIVSGALGHKKTTLIYLQKSNGQGFEPPRDPSQHGLPAVDKGVRMKLADMNNNGNLDLVMYGTTENSQATAFFKVFKNTGDGKFTQMADLGKDLPMEDFEDRAGAWGKAANHPDNKCDKDILGVYNQLGASKGVLELEDFNGDGRIDILFAGAKGTESGVDSENRLIQRDWETSGVFINTGDGNFKYLTGPGYPEAGVPSNPETEPQRSYPQIAKVNRGFSVSNDFNGDSKKDVIVLGQANMGSLAGPGSPETQRNGLPIGEVYLGKGDGTFRVIKNCGLPKLIDGAARCADINKDGKIDVVISGNTGHPKDPAGGRILKIYFGNGDGTFRLDNKQTYERVPNNTNCLVPIHVGDISLGDLDGDNDLDMVAAGNENGRCLYLYINDKGKFSYINLDKMKHGIGTTDSSGVAEADATTDCDVSIIDIDGDNDMDIIINGRGGSSQLLVFLNVK